MLQSEDKVCQGLPKQVSHWWAWGEGIKMIGEKARGHNLEKIMVQAIGKNKNK